jgi:competence protein ComEC
MKLPKLRLIILIILLFAAFFSLYVAFKEDRQGELMVAFLNIGQGDAIFIESPSGNQMLIDGGQGRSILRELSKVMPFYDRSIDAVLATHPDQDHIGGLPEVFQKYEVGLFMEPGVSADTSAYEELKGKIEILKIERLEARRGMVVDLGGGAFLEILFPDRDPSGMETNSASIVTQLTYGEHEFLLTGDSPTSIENYLVSLNQGQTFGTEAAQGLSLASDVLKAGHHGSKTSTGGSFLAAVNPQYVIISAGKDNRYGHPSPEVLETITKFGAQILRTDQDGRIIFKSDGVDLRITHP